MKRVYFFCLLLFLLLSASCSNVSGTDEKEDLKSVLKEIVIEKHSGQILDYTFLDLDIDSVRVKDINAFIEKCFPKEGKVGYGGIPYDFDDERFNLFIAPLKDHSNDEEVCFLSIKHKYSFFNPDYNKKSENINYHLFFITAEKYRYVDGDLCKDGKWR